MATAGERYFYGTGRRKTAVARVRLYPGTGEIVINGQGLPDRLHARLAPGRRAGAAEGREADQRFNVQAKVAGGGITGWAGAVSHGIARALVVVRRGAEARAAPPEPADARLPHEGAQEGRPQARPQGAAVHEALASRTSTTETRRPLDVGGRLSYCSAQSRVAVYARGFSQTITLNSGTRNQSSKYGSSRSDWSSAPAPGSREAADPAPGTRHVARSAGGAS